MTTQTHNMNVPFGGLLRGLAVAIIVLVCTFAGGLLGMTAVVVLGFDALLAGALTGMAVGSAVGGLVAWLTLNLAMQQRAASPHPLNEERVAER